MTMIIETCFGKAYLLEYWPNAKLYRVRLLNWTKEDIERMGGDKEAWIVFGEDQVYLTLEQKMVLDDYIRRKDGT